MAIKDNVKVEITVRNPKNIEFNYPKFLSQYLDGKKNEKTIFMVPGDWVGFKNGFVKELIHSGLDVYLALAFSTTEEFVVTDFNGNTLKPFVHHFLGGIIYKYVKKNFIVETKDQTFKFSLDIAKEHPIVIEE